MVHCEWMLLATDSKLFIFAWYASGFRCTLDGLNEAGRLRRQWTSFWESPFIILETRRGCGFWLLALSGRWWGHAMAETEKNGETGEYGMKEDDRRVRGMWKTWDGEEGHEEERKYGALEETKRVFSSRRRIQMERSVLSFPRSFANLPPLCPRSPRINVARHLARYRTANPHEYICRPAVVPSQDVQLTSRACIHAPWN